MLNRSPIIGRSVIVFLSVALSGLGVFNPNPVLATGVGNGVNPKNDPQLVGQLIVSGSATVNDKRAITGATIFNNSRIGVACSKGSLAIVNLGRLGRVELSPGSKMVLRFTEGLITGDLLEGRAVVSTPAGVKVAINRPDGMSLTDGKEAAVTPVATQRGVRCVPVAMSSSSSTSTADIGPRATAAMLAGIGAAAAIAAMLAASDDQVPATNRLP